MQKSIFGYAKSYSRSHDAVIRVYDDAGNVIETHEHAGDFKEPRLSFSSHVGVGADWPIAANLLPSSELLVKEIDSDWIHQGGLPRGSCYCQIDLFRYARHIAFCLSQ
jgi:hypothetical protein